MYAFISPGHLYGGQNTAGNQNGIESGSERRRKRKENVSCCKQAAPEPARAEAVSEKNQHGIQVLGAAHSQARKRDGNELDRSRKRMRERTVECSRSSGNT